MSTIFISIQTQEAHREAGDHTEEAIRDRCLSAYEGFHLPSNSIKLKHRNENKGLKPGSAARGFSSGKWTDRK